MPRQVIFRIQGKQFFLTYPNVTNEEITKEVIAAHIAGLGAIKYIVCKELHENGTPHYHAVVIFRLKKDIRDPHFFDVEEHHCNIQTVRNVKDSVNYVAKDGDYINHGFVITRQFEDPWTVLEELASSGVTPTEIITDVLRRTGTNGLRVYSAIERYVERMNRPTAVHLPLRDWIMDFTFIRNTPDVLGKFNTFIMDALLGPDAGRDGRKSLWVTGPSRMGKTELARSLGEHWYMNGQWNVDCYDDNALYGVLDDIPWELLKFNYKGLLGMQKDVTVTDKYKKKSVIKGGRPVIVLSNEMPDFAMSEMEWMAHNIVFVNITGKLY